MEFELIGVLRRCVTYTCKINEQIGMFWNVSENMRMMASERFRTVRNEQ